MRTQRSLGTLARIADFWRLLFRCVEQATKQNMANVHWAFDILFELLDRFEDADHRMDFFADEGGRGWLASTGSKCFLEGFAFYRLRRIRPNVRGASKHLSAATAITSVRDCLRKHARSRFLLKGRSLRNCNAERIMRSAVCPCPVSW